jgi:hypothetical protein
MTRAPVLVESPYRPKTKRVDDPHQWACELSTHIEFAQAACYDSFMRGEAPFASHLFYTQFLCDETPKERTGGIECGFAMGDHWECRVFYVNLGWSTGMKMGFERAQALGQRVVYRELTEDWRGHLMRRKQLYPGILHLVSSLGLV